jgi:DNA mismatch repair protein MSH6
VEIVQPTESFPKSTAVDLDIRRRLERSNGEVHPWEAQETLKEIHRRGYYPKASKTDNRYSATRWPQVLRAAVEGNADLAISSLGAALFYLQRNLIDAEILSMGIVKAYVPPEVSLCHQQTQLSTSSNSTTQERSDAVTSSDNVCTTTTPFIPIPFDGIDTIEASEVSINHMALDGTTLYNLEILTNSVDHKVAGSLWSKINNTKTPHGNRLLRAWLLRPLFRKCDIDRRLDAVEELISGGAGAAMAEASSILSRCGDIERLLSRVHSMKGSCVESVETSVVEAHPSDRAILYENATYTKRKVADFSKVLHGLRFASQIPEVFAGLDIQSGLLRKIVRHSDNGGCFPRVTDDLDWFFSNFDCDRAAKGMFEPGHGIDDLFDESCATIDRIISELDSFKEDMCTKHLKPTSLARSAWKYINTQCDSKDKYLIELPASMHVPNDFVLKGKRGTGTKQVNKYRSSVVGQFVSDLEEALETQRERKARGMRLIFAKFDSLRCNWEAIAHATAMLDALGSMAKTASKGGYVRPTILLSSSTSTPTIRLVQARHPCVETTIGSDDFIPNDLCLGGEANNTLAPRVLLLSGPNMGGSKYLTILSLTREYLISPTCLAESTLLRQTCLIAILAQIGSFVPAVACEITPVDRIFTRLGASDRILMGQSTFFVEVSDLSLFNKRLKRYTHTVLTSTVGRDGYCTSWSNKPKSCDHGRIRAWYLYVRWNCYCKCDHKAFSRNEQMSRPVCDSLSFASRRMEGITIR